MYDIVTYTSSVPFLAVLVSLAAVPLIYASSNKPNMREFWTLLAAFIKFPLVLSLLPGVFSGQVAEFTIVEISPGLALQLRADSVGMFFAVVASGLWILTSFYSIGYMRGANEKKQTRYFASFAVCLSATIGIAFSANLLTFLIFYEILSLATYPLVVHKEDKEALRSGRQYLLYAMSAGVVLIAAIGLTYSIAGTLDFQPGGIFTGITLDPTMIKVIFILFIAGVGVKAGIMPLQSWLPAAMVAPTPVSALLHAVAVVKAGVFGVIRVVGFVFGPEVMHVFGLNLILATFAGATVILASLIALNQNNLKRRLAYSTVGHLSYIVLGVALLTPDGFTGGLLHLANHATTKICLFFCAGAIYVNLHKTEISELDGIGKVMPWTMAAFTIGAMGLSGLPPINAFVSKWFLCRGAMEADQMIILGIFLLSGLLNAAYFFPIVQRAFFRKGGKELEKYGEASPFMVVPICIVATLSILLGLQPNFIFNFFDLATSITQSVFHLPSTLIASGVWP
ncbi:multisubunit sodium/proton antiporter, MrpD subunit (TC 2.A.63.1) [Desulfonatronum thiosulfatophilum]|uniref:Multisubunit sodium/proton antiporter, MrpD subunit (TC 2.A.63.1) n=1 Tax=Desulfonatronum thiosulfatophilum TaxID=617002 RepID=A0A1G6EPR7_9BACT|nr:monovalent cation/H+ antiporter subunit D family protein [Desulfonatronum thiosulfatophilum]SDB58885.1 multisubunit sodium/proton antiporter, MrpD subunit (TC 2.A.63.1) [Desulfonatronum thiosulfatophilum]